VCDPPIVAQKINKTTNINNNRIIQPKTTFNKNYFLAGSFAVSFVMAFVVSLTMAFVVSLATATTAGFVVKGATFLTLLQQLSITPQATTKIIRVLITPPLN
jgi:hypothetical protein